MSLEGSDTLPILMAAFRAGARVADSRNFCGDRKSLGAFY